MAEQHLQWITVESCILDYMDESEQSNHKYFKLHNIAYRGMYDMGMDFFFPKRSFKVPVLANLTAPFPTGSLKITKVGVFNEQGEVIPLGTNSNLSAAFDMSPTRLEQTQDNTIPTQINQQGVYWNNYWNGQSFSNVYGYPSGQPNLGTYTTDNANGVIVLSQGFVYPYILVECICAPEIESVYYIPVQFREALVSWLRWKDIISIPVKTHVANANVLIRRKDFYNERRLAIARYDPVNLPDLYQWNLMNQRLTVKA